MFAGVATYLILAGGATTGSEIFCVALGLMVVSIAVVISGTSVVIMAVVFSVALTAKSNIHDCFF